MGLARASGRNLVAKLDMLVEGTDVPEGMGYRNAARKAVAMCVSDFAAKGVRPGSFMISLGLRRGTSMRQVRELGMGLRDAEREWGVALIGGDTNEAKELVIDCAMLGFADRIVPRSGAKPGDAIVVTGPFGFEPAGLRILEKRAKAEKRFASEAVRRVFRPTPNLEAGVALAPFLSASMDSSDGLSRSLHTIAKASGVGLEIESLPAGEGVREFAKQNSLPFRELVLEGGEEYAIVATLASSKLPHARRALRRAGATLKLIGRVAGVPGSVTMVSGEGRERIRDAGWTHLA